MAAHCGRMKTKSIFKSKTALLAAATTTVGAIGFASDSVREFITANAPAILVCLGVANAALRFVTKGRVTLFPD